MIDAMVFAAGLGTRLRPLTDSVPKALIEVGGMTVLERTVRRIAKLDPGIIVVNAHHHAEQVALELERLRRVLAEDSRRSSEASGAAPAPLRIELSLEEERPLETGGGLRQARHLFGRDRAILLHNVDVVSELDLADLVTVHGQAREYRSPIATLAVHVRPSRRQLLFDAEGLYGRRRTSSSEDEICRAPTGVGRPLAFTGVHIVSPSLLETLEVEGPFSIVDHYLSLASQGQVIAPRDVSGVRWWEIGTAERLAAARADLGGPPRSGGPG